jgi:hypothetical protein
VSTGKPITIPSAVIEIFGQSSLFGTGTFLIFSRITATVPAIAARPKVNVHGSKLGNESLTIGSVNENIVTPSKANKIPDFFEGTR